MVRKTNERKKIKKQMIEREYGMKNKWEKKWETNNRKRVYMVRKTHEKKKLRNKW